MEKIRVFLEKRAEENPVFALAYDLESKPLDLCEKYIATKVLEVYGNEMKLIGMRNGYAKSKMIEDEDVFRLAVEFYESEVDLESISNIQYQMISPQSNTTRTSSGLKIETPKKKKTDANQLTIF